MTAGTFVADSSAPGFDDTRFRTFRVPWRRDVDFAGRAEALRLEASIGFLTAKDHIELATPSGLSVVDEDWLSAGVLLGAGWRLPLAERWRLIPGLAFSLSRLENDTRYNAVAQTDIAPANDGILFNWDAWAASAIASLAVEHERELGPTTACVRARYAWSLTDVFSATNEIQEGTDENGFLLLRAEVEGPTPLTLGAHELGWDAFAGGALLDRTSADVLGFDRFYQLGGGIDVPTPKWLPPLRLSGAWIFGPDVRGWSLGLSLSPR